jgi:hypothetical protein
MSNTPWGQQPRRDETPTERLDRNWNELLQELRVTQTGIQILFGFLLTLPFTPRFPDLDQQHRTIYLVVFGLVAVATVCNLSPVIAHRLLFRRREKGWLVLAGSQFAKAALITLGLALVGAVTLVVGLVLDTRAGWISGALLLALVVGLWAVLPVSTLIRDKGSGSGVDRDRSPGR